MKTIAEHRLKNDLAETRRVGALIEEFARSHRLPASVRQALDLALVEWVTNVITYAYDDRTEHSILLRLRVGPGEVRAEVEDDGRPFNPLTLPPADITEPLETRRPGGLGVHLMRQVTDGLEYRREQSRNHLTFIKRLP